MQSKHARVNLKAILRDKTTQCTKLTVGLNVKSSIITLSVSKVMANVNGTGGSAKAATTTTTTTNPIDGLGTLLVLPARSSLKGSVTTCDNVSAITRKSRLTLEETHPKYQS